MTPFQRIAVFAAGAAIWAAIAVSWVYVSGWVALAAAIGGIATAAIATLERIPTIDVPKPEEELETGKLHVSTRDEIERRARRERDDDLDD